MLAVLILVQTLVKPRLTRHIVVVELLCFVMRIGIVHPGRECWQNRSIGCA